jgi:predicted nuclease of predicted toxin-antitoxin system
MRLLLDESVPSRLRRSLSEHSVRTVVEAGWSGVKNGKLLALAATEFDAFITVDKNLPFQQNLATLPIALVVLDSLSSSATRTRIVEAHVLYAGQIGLSRASRG